MVLLTESESWSMMASRWDQLQLNHMHREGGKLLRENWTIVTKNGVMVAGQIYFTMNKRSHSIRISASFLQARVFI